MSTAVKTTLFIILALGFLGCTITGLLLTIPLVLNQAPGSQLLPAGILIGIGLTCYGILHAWFTTLSVQGK